MLTEDSLPDGEHVYAVTKRIGEEMLAEYDEEIPSCIIRLAALFSDWCEYAPLYIFLETWLSKVWNSNIIGGRGTTAIPYMHVREMGPFIRKILELEDGTRSTRGVHRQPERDPFSQEPSSISPTSITSGNGGGRSSCRRPWPESVSGAAICWGGFSETDRLNGRG